MMALPVDPCILHAALGKILHAYLHPTLHGIRSELPQGSREMSNTVVLSVDLLYSYQSFDVCWRPHIGWSDC